jgi:alpha-galactosidase
MRSLRARWLWTVVLLLVGGVLATTRGAEPAPAFWSWAPKPPMGWNSWDCFATTVTEAQTKAQADYIAAHLAPHGWQYIVVDIQWYEPASTGFDYRQGAKLVMDEWGRLLPAPNRFPSAAGGAGFKPLADYVHAKGLKFGIHLMRGIPRQAVEQNTPVLGTSRRAQDVANQNSVCAWNTDMYGVDMTKPGAQAYYDSVFALIASWGVDYVKIDDISRPYHDNEKEIEAVRAAIDRTGRPIVLSLSPGETALTAAEHVTRHANLWRISDDFWDSWPSLYEQFARLDKWTPHRGPGHWPDADMLPFGVLDMGRRTTRFTRDEQITVMTLWSIARSPLMHGGDMTKMDDFTLALLTNDEVLAVNQDSSGGRQLFNHGDLIAWVAEVPGSADKYLALFNARDRIPLVPAKAAFRSAVVSRSTPGHALAIDADVAGAPKLFLVVDDAGDGSGWDHALWVEPRLVAADGRELKLTDLPWVHATAGWGEVSKEKAPSGRPMAVEGKPVAWGIGAHAVSVIEYDLPAGFARFRAVGAIDDGGLTQPRGGTVRFLVYAVAPGPEADQPGLPVAVRLADLGFSGPCRIRDLWQRKDRGAFTGEFAPEIPWHGAGLYRVSSAPR